MNWFFALIMLIVVLPLLDLVMQFFTFSENIKEIIYVGIIFLLFALLFKEF